MHPRYLGAQSQVLDLGANYGLFAKAITARFGCRCLAVEPSSEPFAAIAETPLISKLQAAAASKSGTVPFHIATDPVFSSPSPSPPNPIVELSTFTRFRSRIFLRRSEHGPSIC